MRWNAVMLATAVVAAGATAQTAPRSPSVQQAFDAAAALTSSGKHAEALAAWEALEVRVQRNPRTQAIVQVRKGRALMRLRRLDEAAGSIRAGLAALPSGDATLVEDRADALLALAAIDMAGLDYAGAAGSYRAAAAIAPTPTHKFSALIGEVSSQTFVDPEAGLPAVATLEAMITSTPVDPRSKAMAKIAISELHLNLGRFEEARRAGMEAVKLLGGLTLRLDLLDAAARGDVALAALKLGRRDEAREYLRYTGAGSSKTNLNPAQQLIPPDCGVDTGLRPDDVAVIEFSVNQDGEVVDSAPVYASRQGEAALAFARAARGWSWTADGLKELPVFFRTRVRVEMRCSTGFERPSTARLLHQDLALWFEGKGAKLPEEGRAQSFAGRLREDRARLATARAAGNDSVATAAALYRAAANPAIGAQETATLAREALAIVTREGAPPAARLAVERLVWLSVAEGDQSRRYRDSLARALTAPPYADDATASAAVSLLLVEALGRRDLDRSRMLLRQVGENAALPAAHPLRVGALVRLASLEQEKGELAAARSAFERTGLSAQQCALLDAPPRRKAVTTSNAYPPEAVGWGFSGWVRAQHDVDAEGRPANARVVVAYPAFVFSDATLKMVGNARYEKTFRPDGGLGCGGLLFGVRFEFGG